MFSILMVSMNEIVCIYALYIQKCFSKNLAIFEIKLKNLTELNRPQKTI